MEPVTISRNGLRAGVSAAALAAAAWGLPGTAAAQTCTLGNTLQGVQQGSLVACPQGQELTFPGANPQGEFGIPNGSTINNVVNGTNPDHQFWTYDDPSGVGQTVFIRGLYDLRNGIGGSTLLDGSNILDFSGAGACGAGGQVCPGFGGPGGIDITNQSGVGSGAGGGFAGYDPFDPFGARLPDSFTQVNFGDGAATTCGGMPSGSTCGFGSGGSRFHYGPIFTPGSSGPPPGSDDQVTIHGTGFNDPYFDDDLLSDFQSCQESSGSSCVFEQDDGRIRAVVPSPTTRALGGGVIFDDGEYILTEGFNFKFGGEFNTDVPLHIEIPPQTYAQTVGKAERDRLALFAAVQNESGDAGGGAQGTFSVPDLSNSGFMFTSQPGGNGYALSTPLAPAGSTAYDLGNGQTVFVGDYSALSDLPEVVSVSPGRNTGGVSPTVSFVLTFSAPMDQDAVEDNFIIRAFTDESLTVDTGEQRYRGCVSDNPDTCGSPDIWDDSAFDVDWNSDDTEVTFTFEDERALPSDKDTENTPDYLVTLRSEELNNADGTTNTDYVGYGYEPSEQNWNDWANAVPGTEGTGDDDYFRLTDGDFENYYRFQIQTDEDKPELDSVTAVDAENGAIGGDEVRVRFNEPMVFYTLAAASGAQTTPYMESDRETAGVPLPSDDEAIIEYMDVTILTPDLVDIQVNPGDTPYNPGDQVHVEVDTTVTDPAGNTVDSGDDAATAN